MKKIVIVALMCSAMLCVYSCGKRTASPVGEPYSDYEGVYLELVSVDVAKDNKTMILQWHNDTAYEVRYDYDDEYCIEKKTDNGEWEECDVVMWVEECGDGYYIKPWEESGDIYEYDKYYKVSKKGTYRVGTVCSVYDGAEGPTVAKVWAEFEVK